MLILLSPAKSLDYETPATTPEATSPIFIQEAKQLIEQLR
ncbi:MAG: peroxide stress protein YaaA, partial [Burkholderiales bacterium]